MSVTERITVGEPMPRIVTVAVAEGFSVVVEWAAGERSGLRETIDLGPDILTYALYRPLRDNPAGLASVHLIEDGSAIAWGEDDAIDMPATAIERLAAETMVADDFARFLKRNRLTFDAAAVQLGISRRLVAYYASGRPIPRYIALACERLDQVLGTAAG